MSQPIAYLPGLSPETSAQSGRPLGRFLPPIQPGIASEWLTQRFSPGSWVLDPFGASPDLAVEIARSGYRLLVAANNPISRFLIELAAAPPGEDELRSALAELASAQRAGERIEPLVRALYNTECAQCGRTVEAEAFIWERDANAPEARIYTCPYCKDSGERPSTPADVQRAAGIAASSLHRARALERVAPLDDPDREFVEEALSVYLPRAVYALFTLVNRLDSFSSTRRRLVSALLLAAFDQSNALWSHPTRLARPRQLAVPPRFLEKNIWLSLENAVQSWSQGQAALPQGSAALPLTIWPELPPESGGICLFEGRLKDLALQFQDPATQKIELQAVLTALPRPNQAFWTLSALWAGWLWGHAASSLFKSILRRRRFDWSWHSVALGSAFNSLSPLLTPGTPCLGLIGEPEAGFLAAAVLAADQSGLELAGIPLREEPEGAQIAWRCCAPWSLSELTGAARQELVQEQVSAYLQSLGEPAHYLQVYTVALAALADAHALTVRPEQAASPVQPNPQADRQTGSLTVETMRQIDQTINTAISQGGHFARYAGSSRSLEVGHWWLDEQAFKTGQIAEPLADRLEIFVVQQLQSHPENRLHEIDRIICREFPGLFTPNLDLLLGCLESYAEPSQSDPQSPAESETWSLRPAELPQRRRADLAEMQLLLMQIGKRLGYKLVKSAERDQTGVRPPVIWQNQSGVTQYSFHLIASGVLGRIVLPARQRLELSGSKRGVIVLPGSRAGWVEYKLRRDPHLRSAVENGWLLVKFRHIRWLAQNDNLNPGKPGRIAGSRPAHQPRLADAAVIE